ncbi:MAG: permease-like cell division protein FtsX [Candidatus Paceibacterota bacterium]|jgi:cell division transport system permease protein
MFWINTKRIFKFGIVNFWRNGLVSFASVLAMTVTLSVVGGLFLANNYMTSALNEVKSKVDISISFKVDTSLDNIDDLKEDLSFLPEVKEIIYSSRESELANFREKHKDNEILMQSLNEVGNPFGARLNILAVDPSQYDVITHFIENKTNPDLGGQQIVDQISYKKDVVDKLLRLIETSKKISFGISFVLALLAILVVFNTISLAIYTSREEISVMRLVGASNFYVKGPFVIEGVIAGILSSFISLAILYPATIWVRDLTAGVYGGVNLVSFYLDNFGKIFIILFLTGISLGLIASFWATRRYAKI